MKRKTQHAYPCLVGIVALGLVAIACNADSGLTCDDACDKQVNVCGIEPNDVAACTAYCEALAPEQRNLDCFVSSNCAEITAGTCASGSSCESVCEGRECGADGCGGTCGTCGDGSCNGAGQCVAECPAASHQTDNGCTCDAGFVPGPDCTTCVADDADGCGADAYPQGADCFCVHGYQPNAAGCGCVPAGSIGSPCAADTECLGSDVDPRMICANSMRDWWPIGQDAVVSAFPGGYCTRAHCADELGRNNCGGLGGACVRIPRPGNDVYACVVECTTSAQCRAGYTCRSLDESETAVPGSFCLPSNL